MQVNNPATSASISRNLAVIPMKGQPTKLEKL
ncbi:hypothetical protein SKA34_12485 [Photobacterium sp. SKA34]|nr:hypothetical protein SKA34_12485 [Photobacterium sp. SKA34]